MLNQWFDAFEETMEAYQITMENAYNMDESGAAIGIVQATRAIVDNTVGSRFQGEPGRQEWVTAVECICADGTALPPLIIFKAENLSRQWIPANVHDNWRFSCN